MLHKNYIFEKSITIQIPVPQIKWRFIISTVKIRGSTILVLPGLGK